MDEFHLLKAQPGTYIRHLVAHEAPRRRRGGNGVHQEQGLEITASALAILQSALGPV